MPAKSIKWVLIIIATGMFMYPAFYNGFPIVFSDTGTYIKSGFEYVVPDDRPIFYGLFLRYTSLATSLWFSVFAQSFIVSWILYEMIEKLIKDEYHQSYIYCVVTTLLAIYSAVPFFSSIVIPDIFTPLSFMLFCFLLFDESKRKLKWIMLALIYLFFSFTHLSNIMSLSILVAITWFVVLVFKGKLFIQTSRLIALTILTGAMWIIMPAINSLFGFGFRTNNSSHVFFMGKMIDNGMLVQYLNNEEGAKKFVIYAYKDSLPAGGSDFLWQPNSVLYKTGGWEANKEEYNQIIRNIIFSKKYLLKYIGKSFTEMCDQLTKNDFGQEYYISYKKEDPPSYMIEWNLKGDYYSYTKAQQYMSLQRMDFRNGSDRQSILIVLSLLIILLYLLHTNAQGIIAAVSILLIFFIISNAAVTGLLSAIASRYNSRVSWCIFFMAIVIVAKYVLTLVNKFNKDYAG
jgi:hypothetical protein